MLSPSLVLSSYFYLRCSRRLTISICAVCTVWWYPFPLLVGTLDKDICAQSPGCIPDPQLDGEFFLATHSHCVLDPIVSRNPLLGGMIINYDQNIKVPFHFHCNRSLDS